MGADYSKVDRTPFTIEELPRFHHWLLAQCARVDDAYNANFIALTEALPIGPTISSSITSPTNSTMSILRSFDAFIFPLIASIDDLVSNHERSQIGITDPIKGYHSATNLSAAITLMNTFPNVSAFAASTRITSPTLSSVAATASSASLTSPSISSSPTRSVRSSRKSASNNNNNTSSTSNLNNDCVKHWSTMSLVEIAEESKQERVHLVHFYSKLHHFMHSLCAASTRACQLAERQAYVQKRLFSKKKSLTNANEIDRYHLVDMETNEQLHSMLSILHTSRQMAEWVYRHYSILHLLHRVKETMRILYGTKSLWKGHEPYIYPPDAAKLYSQNQSKTDDVSTSMEFKSYGNSPPQSMVTSAHHLDEHLRILQEKVNMLESLLQANEVDALASCQFAVPRNKQFIYCESIPVCDRLHNLLQLDKRNRIPAADVLASSQNLSNKLNTLTRAVHQLVAEYQRLSKRASFNQETGESSLLHLQKCISDAEVENRALRDLFRLFHLQAITHASSVLDDLISKPEKDFTALVDALKTVDPMYDVTVQPKAPIRPSLVINPPEQTDLPTIIALPIHSSPLVLPLPQTNSESVSSSPQDTTHHYSQPILNINQLLSFTLDDPSPHVPISDISKGIYGNLATLESYMPSSPSALTFSKLHQDDSPVSQQQVSIFSASTPSVNRRLIRRTGSVPVTDIFTSDLPVGNKSLSADLDKEKGQAYSHQSNRKYSDQDHYRRPRSFSMDPDSDKCVSSSQDNLSATNHSPGIESIHPTALSQHQKQLSDSYKSEQASNTDADSRNGGAQATPSPIPCITHRRNSAPHPSNYPFPPRHY